MNANGSDLSNLIPAYALDALDPDERTAFESWLQHHPEAQAVLAEYQTLADRLVLTVPARPAPDHLHADLRRRLAASPSSSAEPHRLATAEHRPITLPAQTKRPGSRAVRLWLAAAAVIALAVLGIVIARELTKSGPQKTDPAKLYAKIEAEQGATRFAIVPGQGQENVGGNLVVSAQGTQAVICVWQLPALEPDQTYQLWLLDTEGTRRSGGLFQANKTGGPTYIAVPLEKPISAYQGFGVSIEPAGGSPLVNQPSGPSVFRVPLT